jgi:hypothetical protein
MSILELFCSVDDFWQHPESQTDSLFLHDLFKHLLQQGVAPIYTLAPYSALSEFI